MGGNFSRDENLHLTQSAPSRFRLIFFLIFFPYYTVAVDTILGKMSGSSMASAITAGAAAQFMQWAVVEGNSRHVESREFRSYLILGASRSADLMYPNREWGYGKLNIAGTFNMLAGLL